MSAQTTLTVEQQAWQIVNEYAPRWIYEYVSRYPGSTESDQQRAKRMAHYCVVAALGGEPHV